MSIYNEITNRIAEGRLIPLRPLMPSTLGLAPRHMYLTETINSLLTGPWSNDEWEERCGYLHADLDRFVQGGVIPVATRPLSGGRSSYMRQLFRWREEVWEIRSRDPQPGIRILGRFADTDVFIATSWWHRSDLGGPESRQWRDAIVECKTQWRNLFPAYEPKSVGNFKSGNYDDYPTACISNTLLV